MSSEQQGPDEQESAADYVRADTSKFPRAHSDEPTLAGFRKHLLSKRQAAHDAKGQYLSRNFYAALLGNIVSVIDAYADEFTEATKQRRAQREAAYGLRALADRYEQAEPQHRDEMAEQAGQSLSLTEAGLIRRVAKALEQGLPDVIVDAHVDGMSAPAIARELSCSTRHAYQVIKDYPWEAVWTLYRATGDDQWEEVTTEVVETTETADDLANAIIGKRLTDDLARTGARVLVWRAGDGNDPDKARGECEIEASTQTDH
ncbi:hypothetical protein [Streptomyces antarcticus]|uniref:hypothetical protein n=1 Tax=Streptomyces antarcticus TaxID=2996458 RepID=UPI00226F4302|nr:MULTISPECIES: hypothetical protein [unclassified Streptomyces]MCY0942586.1 hypothetical protein [Streptomyces sp. H34-AA3]MCZ4081332.1 hypothetical protein [Streptomyces sp. H34-S5]